MIAIPIVFLNLFVIQTSYAYSLGMLLKLGTLGVFLGCLFGLFYMSIFYITIWYYFDLNEIKATTIMSIKQADEKLINKENKSK